MGARLPELAEPIAGCGGVGVVTEDRADTAVGSHGRVGRFVGADGKSFLVSQWRMTASMGSGASGDADRPRNAWANAEAMGWRDSRNWIDPATPSVRVFSVASGCAAPRLLPV